MNISPELPAITFFELLYEPVVLRHRSVDYACQFRNALRWLAATLAREPVLADFNRETMKCFLSRLATVGLAKYSYRNVRKRLWSLWRYLHQQGLAAAPLRIDGRRRPPKYSRHSPSGQATIIIDGRKIYLGKHGSPESLARYFELVGHLPSRADVPAPPNASPERPWLMAAPQPGDLLNFYRTVFRLELRPQLSAKDLARYDCAVNHFHDFTGRLIPLAEVTPDLLDAFRAWADSLAMTPGNRSALRGCLRRIMRAADPPRFPKHDGANPRTAVGELERRQEAERGLAQREGRGRRHGDNSACRLPEPIGGPGTISHFWKFTYLPQVCPQAGRVHRGNYLTLFRKMRLCFDRDLRLDELSREIVAELQAWLAEQGNGANTVHHERTRLCAVWRYAHELGQAPDVPRWRKTRIPREQPDAWTLDEGAKIIDAAGRLDRPPIAGIPAGKFWKAILLVGWWTALRRGSLVKIRTADVNLDGWLYIPAGRIKNKVGKKFKLGADALAAVGEILDPRRELLFPIEPDDKILGTHFRAILKLAGVPKGDRLPNSLFHKWRRTVATHTAVRAGLAAAIALLGHSGPEVTARYIDPSFLPANDATEWLPSLTDLAQRQDAIAPPSEI